MPKNDISRRLQAAGLDPTLFSAYDLRRIKRFADEEPFPDLPAFPTMPIEPLLDENFLPTCEALAVIADRCLAALAAHGLMLAFSTEGLRSELTDICVELSEAIPDWMHTFEKNCDAVHASCSTLISALEHDYAALRKAACLHAAALLRAPDRASRYLDAIVAEETLIHAAERRLAEADEAIEATARLLEVQLPALLDTILPLVNGVKAEFSIESCRSAALSLRDAARLR